MQSFSSLKKFLSSHEAIVVLIFAVITTMSAAAVSKDGFTNESKAKVELRDLKVVTLVTGKIKEVTETKIYFKNSGTVENIFTEIGDNIYTGQLLISLSNAPLFENLLKKETDLKSEIENVKKLLAVTSVSNDQATLDKVAVIDKLKSDLKKKYESIPNFLKKIDEEVTLISRENIDSLFTFDGNNFYYKNSACSGKLGVEIGDERVKFESKLKFFQTRMASLTIMSSSVEREETILSSYDAVLALASLNEKLIISNLKCSNVDATFTKYVEEVKKILSRVNKELSDISNLKNEVLKLEAELNAINRGINFTERNIALNKITEKRDAYRISLENFSSTILNAPFDGKIIMINIKKGDQVSEGDIAMVIKSNNDFEVVVKANREQFLTTLVGSLVEIKLNSKKILMGVVTEKDETDNLIKISIREKTDQLKLGQAVSLKIITDVKNGVLSIPNSFLLNENGKYSVYLRDKNVKTKRNIQVGILGDGGYIEVISGLTEGEVIVK